MDRNANAALNLRDWTGDVQRGGVAAPVPHVVAQADDPRRAGSREGVGSKALQDHREVAGACDTRTEPRHGGRNPEEGYQLASAYQHLGIW